MTGDIRHPVPLAPDRRPNADLLVQLHAHLEVSLQRGLGDLQRSAHGRVALEAAGVQHGIVVAFLVRLVAAGRSVDRSWWRPVDRLSQDWVLGVVLLHGGEVVWAFQQVLALTRGVLRSYGLAIYALCGEALWQVVGQ